MIELERLRAFTAEMHGIVDRLRGYQYCPLCRGEAVHHDWCELGKLDALYAKKVTR